MGGESTCWTIVRAAAQGDPVAKEAFAVRYLAVVRAYLLARWRSPALRERVDDAVQEVFLECFRARGALARLDPGRPGGFRPFLMGILRNVARRVEERRRLEGDRFVETPAVLDPEADDESVASAVDRAWARGHRPRGRRAPAGAGGREGERALVRVEILRLRFAEGLPIREVAARIGEDAAVVHHEYARARREFRAALEAVVAEHFDVDGAELTAECERVLGAFG